MLRPTQSETLYIQQSCRCLTPVPGKVATIIDYVGNCYAHGMPTEKRIYTLDEPTKPRNSNREPDVITRMCGKCFRIYKGNGSECPYCHFMNGKTKKQIEEDNQAELERITEINKKRARLEVGLSRDFGSLVQLGIKRGYKNPQYWARQIIQSRNKKKINL